MMTPAVPRTTTAVRPVAIFEIQCAGCGAFRASRHACALLCSLCATGSGATTSTRLQRVCCEREVRAAIMCDGGRNRRTFLPSCFVSSRLFTSTTVCFVSLCFWFERGKPLCDGPAVVVSLCAV